MNLINRTLSVAPMMDWTDRHCRYLHRLISKDVLLYTEMVTAPALIHGDADRLLEFNDLEHPIALQLGALIQINLLKLRAWDVMRGMTRSI